MAQNVHYCIIYLNFINLDYYMHDYKSLYFVLDELILDTSGHENNISYFPVDIINSSF